MTVKIELQQETAAELQSRAADSGVSLDDYLLELARSLPVRGTSPKPDSAVAAKDFDAALDDLFSADARSLPTTPSTYPRSDIYADHD